MKTEPIEIRQFNRRVTLDVTVNVTREFRIRAWIALRLMRYAAKILGARFHINSPPPSTRHLELTGEYAEEPPRT